MLENCDKTMHLHFNFDACPMHESETWRIKINL